MKQFRFTILLVILVITLVIFYRQMFVILGTNNPTNSAITVIDVPSNTTSTVEENISLSSSTIPILRADPKILLDAWRPTRFSSPEAVMINKALPDKAFLRDFTPINGVSGYLVLYALNPVLGLEPLDWNEKEQRWSADITCPGVYYGQTVSGDYQLAFIRDGKIVNEVSVPFSDWENWPDHKLETPDPETGAIGYSDINDPLGVWTSNGSLMFRQLRCFLEDVECSEQGMDMLETRQLMPTDLTGDGIANEVQLRVGYLSCGNSQYTIAGYDTASDQVMIYKVNDGDGVIPVYSNFNPRADGTVIFDSGCDHNAENHTITNFKFDQQKKEYIAYHSTGSMACSW